MAGVDPVEVDRICSQELEQAGLSLVRLPEVARSRGEVKTIVVGTSGPWEFQRAWRYWVARGPRIPLDAAEELHEVHGKEVRVDGHCGAPSPREWFKGFGTGHYHVDTPAGLTALADTIEEVLI